MRSRAFDREAHKKLVREAYTRTDQPILVGPVSMLRGWQGTLAETEELLEEMADDGLLRRATDHEKRYFDVRQGYFLV